MPTRRPALALALTFTLVSLGAVGCGGDDAATPSTSATSTTSSTTAVTTTTAGVGVSTTSAGSATTVAGNPPITTTTAGATTSTTAPTVTDAAFGAALKDASDQLDAAGSDLCRIIAVSKGTRRAAPTNPAQVRMALDYLDRSFQVLASALPAANADAAAGLRATAATLRQKAEAANYDPSAFGADNSTLESDGFKRAMTTITNLTKDCPTT